MNECSSSRGTARGAPAAACNCECRFPRDRATTRRGDARGEGIDRDASAPLMPTFTMTDARVRGLRRGERAVARWIRRERKSLRNEVHNANAVVWGPV